MGNTLIFILFLYDGIQRNLGENLRYSRLLGVWKLENQWWYSLKLGDFGDVKGLRPLTSPKPPVSMKPPLVSSFQPPEDVKPQIFAQVSLKPSYKKKKSGFPLKLLINMNSIYHLFNITYLRSVLLYYNFKFIPFVLASRVTKPNLNFVWLLLLSLFGAKNIFNSLLGVWSTVENRLLSLVL